MACLSVFAVLAAACGDDDAPSAEPVDAPPTLTPVPAGTGPAVGDHWHVAFGIYVCDSWIPPLVDDTDPLGIHTRSDGLIHVQPYAAVAAGERATLGRFAEAVSIDLADDRIGFPTGEVFSEANRCDGEPMELRLIRWESTATPIPYEIATVGIADAVFRADKEVWVLALAPPDTFVPQPSWAPYVDQIPPHE